MHQLSGLPKNGARIVRFIASWALLSLQGFVGDSSCCRGQSLELGLAISVLSSYPDSAKTLKHCF